MLCGELCRMAVGWAGCRSRFPFGRGQLAEVVLNLRQLAGWILCAGICGRGMCPGMGAYVCQPEAEVLENLPDNVFIVYERDSAHDSRASQAFCSLASLERYRTLPRSGRYSMRFWEKDARMMQAARFSMEV